MSNKNNLLQLINNYEFKVLPYFQNNFPNDKIILQNFKNFVSNNPNCFDRELEIGHITGSAFILNSNLTHVLLTYHRKLKKWLQLGGHADGDNVIQNVAMKEAQEESGIQNFTFAKNFTTENCCFDLDIHDIPKHKNTPQHKHYDVRFLLIAESNNYIISSESLELKWVPLNSLNEYTNEESMIRQLLKCEILLQH